MRTLVFVGSVLALCTGMALTASGGQVDQNRFAKIESGMTEEQVQAILGVPDEQYERCGESRYTRVCRLHYVYFSEPERAQKITTVIRFTNGVVFDKKRVVH
jgi:hypothetical protein